LLSAEEAFSHESNLAVSLDITSSPVIHVVLVLNLVGEHVEAMSVLTGTSIDVITVGINTLDPAWSVSIWRSVARQHNFTLGSDTSGVKLFH